MKEFNTIHDILDFAIEAEQEALDFYSALAKSASNPDMSKVFETFAGEEMKHKARLLKIKEEGSYSVVGETVPDMKIADYLVDIRPNPGMSYQDALVLAMKKEKAAFKMYSRLAERAPTTELRNIFQSLALEESKHKLRFELEYDEYVLRDN